MSSLHRSIQLIMKSLEELNNSEKAQLLFDLFPDEIPSLVEFMEQVCATVLEETEQGRQSWKDGLITYDFWLYLAEHIRLVIGKYGKALGWNGRLFSEQLFSGQHALFATYCLNLCTKVKQHPNKKFSDTIQLLFN